MSAAAAAAALRLAAGVVAAQALAGGLSTTSCRHIGTKQPVSMYLLRSMSKTTRNLQLATCNL